MKKYLHTILMILFFVLISGFYQCFGDREYVLAPEDFKVIDTILLNEKRDLTLVLDSLCNMKMDSLVSQAMDSIKQERIEEIINILSQEELQ